MEILNFDFYSDHTITYLTKGIEGLKTIDFLTNQQKTDILRSMILGNLCYESWWCDDLSFSVNMLYQSGFKAKEITRLAVKTKGKILSKYIARDYDHFCSMLLSFGYSKEEVPDFFNKISWIYNTVLQDFPFFHEQMTQWGFSSRQIKDLVLTIKEKNYYEDRLKDDKSILTNWYPQLIKELLNFYNQDEIVEIIELIQNNLGIHGSEFWNSLIQLCHIISNSSVDSVEFRYMINFLMTKTDHYEYTSSLAYLIKEFGTTIGFEQNIDSILMQIKIN